MAVQLCSENSSPMAIATNSNPNSNNNTPRISFSYDFLQSDVVPIIEQRPLNSPIDFDFCVRQIESTSADELFSDGKILPTEIKKNLTLTSTIAESHAPETKELLAPQSADRSSGDAAAAKSRSFWRFKRSSSCGSGYGRTLCPLPLLSRSNSTGSTDETKPINMKRSTPLSKESSNGGNISRQNNGGGNCSSKLGSQRPPLKKNLGGYGNGVTINPVLNVPPANLFGVGSIFANGKSKSKKK